MRHHFLLIILFIGWNTCIAQNDIKMLNASNYDTERYKEYKGSPYLWKENKEIIIYDKLDNEHKSINGNYNGVEHEFEVYQNDKFISLPHDTYVKLKVINDAKIDYALYSNVHPDLKNKYCILHEQTSNYSVYENFAPRTSLVKIETPGKATEINKFVRNSEYYILYGSDLISFKLKKKKLIKQFGHKKEIKAFLKRKKIKLKKIEHVLQLFEFLDAKGWLNP